MNYEYDLLLKNYIFSFDEVLDELDLNIDNILIELWFKKPIGINDEDFLKVINILIDNREKLDADQRSQLEIILEQYELYAHKLDNAIVTNNPIKRFIYRESKLNEIQLTRQQYNLKKTLWDIISENIDTFILSAPTSFGKSLLINEMIHTISRNYSGNILIILPTKALINEYYSRLKKEFDNIVTNPFVANNEKGRYVFVGTPERSLLLEDTQFDIVIVDDMYFSSEFVDREKSFVIALKNIEHNKKVFIVPNINVESMKNKLLEYDVELGEYVLKEYGTEDSPVSNSFMELNINVKNEPFSTLEYNEHKMTIENLPADDPFITFSNCLNTLNSMYGIFDGCLIYHCNKTHASKVLNLLEVENTTENVNDEELEILINYIESNLHERSELIAFLREGKSLHNADLDEFTREVIERLYIKGVIKVIYATSTLAKGINLPCKNIFFITKNHDAKKVSEVDIKNILGRVGRFKTFNNGNRIIVNLNKGSSVNDKYFMEDRIKEKVSFGSGIGKLDEDIKKVISEDIKFSKKFKLDNGIETEDCELGEKTYVDYSLGYSKKVVLSNYIKKEIISIESWLPSIFSYHTLLTIFNEVNVELSKYRPNEKFIYGSEEFNAFVYSQIISNTSIRDLINRNKEEGYSLYISENGKVYHKQQPNCLLINYDNDKHINALLYFYLNIFSDIQFKVRSFLLNFIELYKEIYFEEYGENSNFDKYIEMIENDTDSIDVIMLKSLGLRHQFLINNICLKAKDLNLTLKFDKFEQVINFVNENFDDKSPEKYAINELY